MNSTHSVNGVLTPYRIPLLNNTAGGADLDVYHPDNSSFHYIGQSETSATISMVATTDTYWTQLVTLAMDVEEPDLQTVMTINDVNGGTIEPGDTLFYIL